jgi:hypothetical protein
LEEVMETKPANDVPLKHPSAWLPLAMALAALMLVVGHAAVYGIVHETDEGAAAHIWQILMTAQIPIVGWFMLRWLPAQPKQSLLVLGLLGGLWLANFAAVYWLT